MSTPMSSREKAEKLTRIWCIKEAYVKAIAEGVGFGLQRIDVSLSDSDSVNGNDKKILAEVKVDGKDIDKDGWTVDLGVLEEGYIWAYVSESSEIATPKIVQYQQIIDVMQL